MQEPAWKRAGLKLKRTKQADQESEPSEKKPPKRAKLPKSERKPAPESDQLAYLKIFANDKENWKFSKQKQNWLIRNLFTIDKEHTENICSYMSEIKGGARNQVIKSCEKVVQDWNNFMNEEPEKETAEPASEENTTRENTKSNEGSAAVQKNKQSPPHRDMAKRAQLILGKLTDNTPKLEYVD